MQNLFRLTFGTLLSILLLACTESDQQKWSKNSNWNFLIDTCTLNGGSVEIARCDDDLAQQAASTASNYIASYSFHGAKEMTIQLFVSPNHPYYNQIDVSRMTRLHRAPISYVKGGEPNTLSVVIHTEGCNVTTNYRLSSPGKAYEQTVNATGPSCGEDQRAVAEYGLKDGPKLAYFMKN